jgi:hypothetical protein
MPAIQHVLFENIDVRQHSVTSGNWASTSAKPMYDSVGVVNTLF